MIEANFYELSKTPWVKAFPKLIETVFSKGNKVLVFCENLQEISELDNLFWTYEQLSFLPHLVDGENSEEDTPIIISTKSASKNNANILALGSLILPNEFENFSKILVMYQINDSAQFNRIKIVEQTLNDAKCKINKFTQTLVGNWQKVEV